VSGIREKLRGIIKTQSKVVTAYSREEVERLLDETDSAGKAADAILAKFDVKEKKPRYTVSPDVERADRFYVHDNEHPIYRPTLMGCFTQENFAREYADWLNSKETP
jgi:hypothetical protein